LPGLARTVEVPSRSAPRLRKVTLLRAGQTAQVVQPLKLGTLPDARDRIARKLPENARIRARKGQRVTRLLT